MIEWNEFAAPATGGDYPDRFTFTTPGDSVSGELVRAEVATMPDGTRLPALTLRDDSGKEWSVLASQTMLKALLAQHRPNLGDRLGIIYTGDGEPKPGRTAPKLFDVAVSRAEGTAPAAPSTPAAPAAPEGPAVTAASLL